jgi:hypothetical protein
MGWTGRLAHLCTRPVGPLWAGCITVLLRAMTPIYPFLVSEHLLETTSQSQRVRLLTAWDTGRLRIRGCPALEHSIRRRERGPRTSYGWRLLLIPVPWQALSPPPEEREPGWARAGDEAGCRA